MLGDRSLFSGLAAAFLVNVALLLSACGEDGDGNGDGDTLLTGLSGLVIAAVLIWLLVRWLGGRGRRGGL